MNKPARNRTAQSTAKTILSWAWGAALKQCWSKKRHGGNNAWFSKQHQINNQTRSYIFHPQNSVFLKMHVTSLFIRRLLFVLEIFFPEKQLLLFPMLELNQRRIAAIDLQRPCLTWRVRTVKDGIRVVRLARGHVSGAYRSDRLSLIFAMACLWLSTEWL